MDYQLVFHQIVSQCNDAHRRKWAIFQKKFFIYLAGSGRTCLWDRNPRYFDALKIFVLMFLKILFRNKIMRLFFETAR